MKGGREKWRRRLSDTTEKRKKKKKVCAEGCYAGDEGAATHLASDTLGEPLTWGGTHLGSHTLGEPQTWRATHLGSYTPGGDTCFTWSVRCGVVISRYTYKSFFFFIFTVDKVGGIR